MSKDDSENSQLKGLDEISLHIPSLEGISPLSEKSGLDLFSGSPLLGGGGAGNLRMKLQAVEAMLSIALRNSTFTAFVTDLLLALMNSVESEAASILEVDRDKEVLFFRCSVGRASDLLESFQIPLGKGIAGQVVETRQAYVLNYAEENKVHLKSIGDAVGFETLNMVALPVVIRGKVYGVIELLNRQGQPNYSSADVDNLTYLVGIAAQIIELRMMIAWKK